eukprot:1666116-Pleurochrysis_carterae.AAC.1
MEASVVADGPQLISKPPISTQTAAVVSPMPTVRSLASTIVANVVQTYAKTGAEKPNAPPTPPAYPALLINNGTGNAVPAAQEPLPLSTAIRGLGLRSRVCIDGDKPCIVWSIIRELVGVVYDDVSRPWDTFTAAELNARGVEDLIPAETSIVEILTGDSTSGNKAKSPKKPAGALYSRLFENVNGGWTAYAAYKPMPTMECYATPPIAAALTSGCK